MKKLFRFNGSKIRRMLMSTALVFGTLASNLSPVLNSQVVEAASSNNLASVYPSQMTKLKLSLVYTGKEIDSTINSSQSFAITDKYFIVVQAHSTKENAGWIVATSYKNPSSNPAWKVKYNVGHGNGATWNSKKNQIVVIDGSTKYFFNATNGKFVNKVTTGPSGTGIAYDAQNDHYIQTSGSGTSSGRILSNNFTSIKTFDAGHRLVNQDVAYYNGYIYRIGWGGCSYLKSHNRADDAAYCSKHFGEGTSAIYQFDSNGKFIKAYYLDTGYGELESMAFGTDGTPYLMFNSKPDSSHYSVYKVNNLNTKGSTSTSTSTNASTPKITADTEAAKTTNTTKTTNNTKTTDTNKSSATTTKTTTDTNKTTTTTTKPATDTSKTTANTTTNNNAAKTTTTTSKTETTTKPVAETNKTTNTTTTNTDTNKASNSTKTTTDTSKTSNTTKTTVDTNKTDTNTAKTTTTNSKTSDTAKTTTTTNSKVSDTAKTTTGTTNVTNNIIKSTTTARTTEPTVKTVTTVAENTSTSRTTNAVNNTKVNTQKNTVAYDVNKENYVTTIVDTSFDRSAGATDSGVQIGMNTDTDAKKTDVEKTNENKTDTVEVAEVAVPKAGKIAESKSIDYNKIVVIMAVMIGLLAIIYCLYNIVRCL